MCLTLCNKLQKILKTINLITRVICTLKSFPEENPGATGKGRRRAFSSITAHCPPYVYLSQLLSTAACSVQYLWPNRTSLPPSSCGSFFWGFKNGRSSFFTNRLHEFFTSPGVSSSCRLSQIPGMRWVSCWVPCVGCALAI